MKYLAFLLFVGVALAGCSTGGSGDEDRDGLDDKQETDGWEIMVDLLDKRVYRHVYSDPNLMDTDGDGVLDPLEFALALDPQSKDTDEDGLSDCEEVMHTVLAECEDDNWEGVTDGGFRTIGNNADSDAYWARYVAKYVNWTDETGTIDKRPSGDGIPDGMEVYGYNVTLPGDRTRFVQTDPLRVDSDGDFLEDGEEVYIYGVDPLNKDTDGDGCWDGIDPIPEYGEAFDLGLLSVRWAPAGRSGSQEVQLFLHVADNGFTHPEEGGTNLFHGQTRDLSNLDLGPFQQAQCSFTPHFPWVRVSVQAQEINDGIAGDLVDFTSDSVPNNVGVVWWNVRNGSFHWTASSAEKIESAPAWTPESGILSWSGPDGSVQLQPAVIKRHNQNL